MKGIGQYTAEQIKHWNTTRKKKDGNWVPARAEGYYGNIFFRLDKAWRVFKGEADVLIWDEEE